MKELAVYWCGEKRILVGRIAESTKGPLYFEWDREFLQNNIELSPINFRKTPNLVECSREPFDGLPGFIADCIPDGWGRRMLKSALQRSGIVTTEASYLDMLSFLGNESIGALAFEPTLKPPIEDGPVAELHEIERSIPQVLEGTASSLIQIFLENGSSPNGMRPKIILKEANGIWHSEGTSVAGSSWLIKFRADGDPEYIAALEYIYTMIAKEAGVEVAETQLFTSGGKSFFGTKRFDRQGDRRLHVHTLCGLLHTPVTNFSIGYEHLAKVAQLLTKNFKDVEKILRLAAFNVIMSNQDDHTKNVSFLMDELGSWQFAPAYDLTFHRTKFDQHKMHVLGNGKPDLNAVKKLFEEFGFSKKFITSTLAQVQDAAMTFEQKAKEFGIPKNEAAKIFKSFKVGSHS